MSTIEWNDDAVMIAGDIDYTTSEQLRDLIDERIINDRVVIDASGVTFCDSSCVATLAGPAKAGVTVVLRRPSIALVEMLGKVHATELFQIEP
jgi:anti-anti-sigma factor